MGGLTHDITGVSVTPLRIIADDRGAVMHMLRADDALFVGFGECYFSLVKAGSIKAWKRHRVMVQNLVVPVGAIRLVIYDDRPNSPTCGVVREIITGVSCGHYELIQVPAMVWYGFSSLYDQDSLIANCASLPHDPNEVDRLPSDTFKIPYVWSQS